MKHRYCGAKIRSLFSPCKFAAKIFAFLFCTSLIHAAEVLPIAPDQFFNDYAHVVRPNTAHTLNEQLAQFERDTSNQIVVAIYPKLQTDSSLDDYCYRVFHAWGVGQKKLNNGAALFVFIADHKMRIQTGYGLEGALPDAICKRILDDEITPRFKQNDFDGGLTAGVNAMLAATRGEYKGSGRTVHEAKSGASRNAGNAAGPMIFFWILVFIILFINVVRRRGTMYGSRFGGPMWMNSGSGWSSGSSWGGSSGGGGDSGFSGGGGDSGGGGASGSW